MRPEILFTRFYSTVPIEIVIEINLYVNIQQYYLPKSTLMFIFAEINQTMSYYEKEPIY